MAMLNLDGPSLVLSRSARRGLVRRVRRQQAGLDVGLRSDGRRLVLPYPALPHMLVAGLTGSGKSGLLNSLLFALASLENVAILGVDMKRVEFTPWEPRLSMFVVEGRGADLMFSGLREEIERREELMQRLGVRMWRPEFGPWLVLVIDEFAELSVPDLNRLIEAVNAPSSKQNDQALNALMKGVKNQLGLRSAILESFARKCRALGVTMIVATQYPTSDVIDTQVRSQFSLRFMCRVSSKEQVKVCLGNGMEEQVDMTDLSPHQPGSFFVTGLERKPLIARASLIDDDLVAATVAETAHLRVDPAVVFGGGARS